MIRADWFPTRILIVDDKRSVREALRGRIALSSDRYQVETAESGPEALERLSQVAYDVILCDLNLASGMDGTRVTREIRQQAPETRVVVFSGKDSGDHKTEVLAAGAYAYLSKPIDHNELLHTIDTINSIRRTEQLGSYFRCLAAIAHSLQESFDSEQLSRRIVDGAIDLGYARARLYLFDAERQTLVGAHARGKGLDESFGGYEIPLAASPMIGGLFATDQPSLCNQKVIEERFGAQATEAWLKDFQLEEITWLDCPLMVRQKRIGTLSVDHYGRPGERFTDVDLEIMGVFAGLAAQSLNNAQLYEQEALAKASLESILRNAPDAVVGTDLHGIVTFVSPSSERVTGIAPEAMIGQPAASFYVGGQADAHAVMGRLRKEGTFDNMRVVLCRHSGGGCPVSLSASLLEDHAGEAVGTLGILRDLGPIEARSRQYRDLLEGFGYGTLLLDRQGRIRYLNRKAQRLLGSSREEAEGKAFANRVLGAQRDALTEAVEKILGGASEESLDFSLLAGDGGRTAVRGRLTPVRRDGEVTGVAIALYDKQELTALIQSGRLMALGQMVAGIGHEVNNPLNNILMASRELTRRLERDGDTGAFVQRYLGYIEEDGTRIQTIIRQLRELAQPSEFRLRPVSLGELVESTLAFFENRFKEHGISFSLDLEPDLPEVQGDPGRLQQVLVNLLINAEQAMTGQPERKEVAIRCQRRDECLLLEIHDSGRGIPEEIREAVFDPFFSTKESGGTGLGLSISKSILDMHGGDISIHDAHLGRGTCFLLELPISPAQTLSPTPRS